MPGGQAVTFSGSASFSIGKGYVTNLSQQASLTGAQSVSFSKRVGEGTYPLPFNLTVTPQAPPAGETHSLTATVSSRNCNDSGVCAGPSVTVNIAIVGAAVQKGQLQMIAASYRCLKGYLAAASGHRFSTWTSRGSQDIYRSTLAGLVIEVNPSKLRGTANAQYLDGVVTLRKDPRTLTAAECRDLGTTLWEEVSHAIEDSHGDVGWFQDEDRREARVDYMLEMDETWPILERLEMKARKGAKAKELATLWKLYTKKVRKATQKAVSRGYQPDRKQLREWFGWEMNPLTIKRNYKSGKFLPGPQGEELRKAL